MRRAASVTVVLGLAAALFGAAGVLGVAAVEQTRAPATTRSPAAPVAALGAASARDLRGLTEGLQQRLQEQPRDWRSWASLGAAYVQQARVTADPTWFPKAQEAIGRSLSLQPDDNLDALVAGSALAAGRHDFPTAARLGARAEALSPYNAAAKAVLGDALVELGRYDEAFAAYQRLNDVRPGLTAYVRAAYAAELQGALDRAATALTAALGPATDPADVAFVQHRLGELAFAAGDTAVAGRHFALGRSADPLAADPLAGAAKVAAAQGRTEEALRLYADLVERVPQPVHLAAYGDLLLSLGRTEQAAEQYAVVDLQRRVAADNGVAVDLETAQALADRGDPASVAQAVEAARAEHARRDTVQTADALGWALHRAGRSADALPYARSALRLGTADPLIRFHAGAVAAAAGDLAGARRDLGLALRQPGFSPRWAPEARRLMDALPTT